MCSCIGRGCEERSDIQGAQYFIVRLEVDVAEEVRLEEALGVADRIHR